jgi:hypothetical protein
MQMPRNAALDAVDPPQPSEQKSRPLEHVVQQLTQPALQLLLLDIEDADATSDYTNQDH